MRKTRICFRKIHSCVREADTGFIFPGAQKPPAHECIAFRIQLGIPPSVGKTRIGNDVDDHTLMMIKMTGRARVKIKLTSGHGLENIDRKIPAAQFTEISKRPPDARDRSIDGLFDNNGSDSGHEKIGLQETKPCTVFNTTTPAMIIFVWRSAVRLGHFAWLSNTV